MDHYKRQLARLGVYLDRADYASARALLQEEQFGCRDAIDEALEAYDQQTALAVVIDRRSGPAMASAREYYHTVLGNPTSFPWGWASALGRFIYRNGPNGLQFTPEYGMAERNELMMANSGHPYRWEEI